MQNIQDLKAGTFFKRKQDSNKVYTREVYDRYEKKYQCDDYEDISRCIYLKKNTQVFIDFEY